MYIHTHAKNGYTQTHTYAHTKHMPKLSMFTHACMHARTPKMSVSRLDGHPIARTDTNVPI